MNDKFNKFKMYREEDKHECNLIATRINALLTSQSFFLIAGVILYTSLLTLSQTDKNIAHSVSLLPTAIAIMALVTAGLAEIAIVIGCFVLKEWHQDGRDLIDKMNASEKDRINNYYKNREQPDWLHRLSMDVFGILLPFVFAAFWVSVIVWLNSFDLRWLYVCDIFFVIIIVVIWCKLWNVVTCFKLWIKKLWKKR